MSGEIFPVFGESSAAAQPGESPFNNPPPWKKHEALCKVGSFDDFNVDLRLGSGQSLAEDRTRIATICEQFLQQRKLLFKIVHQQEAAIPVLNISRMHDGMKQKALRIYENMPLLALDFFPRVKPVRIDADPPFSADLTLWLSIIQALGCAFLSAFSRHFVYKT